MSVWRACIALIVWAIAGHPIAAEVSMLHDGTERRYLRLGHDDARTAPGLVVLHGAGGAPERIRKYARFNMTSHGWIEIYPQGFDRGWNDGRRKLSGGALRQADDLGFLKALLEREAAAGRLDPARVFVVGLSNGGAMTQRLICQAPDLIAGAAVLSMNFPIGLECPPGKPVPLLFFLGTEDPIVPFDGGAIKVGRKDRGGVMPAPDTLAFYAKRNGCSALDRTAMPDRDTDDGTEVIRLVYTGCDAPLQAFIIEGGGHTWPGTKPRRMLRDFLGRTSQDISTTDLIEDFFSKLASP